MRKFILLIVAVLAVACEPITLERGDATLTTGEAINITYDTAYLKGEALSSLPCVVWFELSESSKMTDSWTTESVSTEGSVHAEDFSLLSAKLTPNTTYYYRLCGKLQYDGYYMQADCGEIRSFTTDKNPPARARIFVDSPSGADFVDYIVVEDDATVESVVWHLFDGYDAKRKMEYMDTETAISNADIYLCQFTDRKNISDYKSVSFNLKQGAFYYGHATVSSIEPEAVCKLSRATCEVKLNVICKSMTGYIDNSIVYQALLANANGGKTAPISDSGTCDLSNGHVTLTTNPQASVSAYANVWLKSSDTQTITFEAVIPTEADEGEAELWFYVKSEYVDSPIKVAMPSFEWRDGNTYTYDVTLNYSPQIAELVMGSCSIEPWGDEQYMDDLSMRKLNTNGHEWVDLGLSVLWATCNLGADRQEDYGEYFAWGETTPKSSYNWSNYKWCKGTDETLVKYCPNSTYGYNGFVDDKTILDPEDDAAHVNWGGSWRMPTQAEFGELSNSSNCTWTWVTMNGVSGYKVVSKKYGYVGNYIFLPASGVKWNSYYAEQTGSDGAYWSSSLDIGTDHNYIIRTAYCQPFKSSVIYGSQSTRSRPNGLTIRPVCSK